MSQGGGLKGCAVRAFFVWLVLAGGGALAQQGSQPSDAPLTPEGDAVLLVPGEDVRVELEGARYVSGTLVEAGSGRLVLESESDVPLTLLDSEMTRLEVRRRRTLQGTLWGAGLGTVGLGAYGVLLCALLSEDSDPNLPICGGAFALVGSVLGAGAGTLVGLSLPRWSTVYERSKGSASPRLSLRAESVEELVRWLSHPGPIGELGVQVGYARELNVDSPGRGPGARLHLLARLGPSLALGPEVAWYPISSRRIITATGSSYDASRELFHLGGLVRLGVDLGFVRPAALVGLAFYSSRSVNFVAYSAGAELEFRFGRGLPSLALEARYHDNLQRLGGGDPRFLTLGAGTRLTW